MAIGTRPLHDAVAAIYPTPPSAIVRSIDGLELRAHPGVLRTDIHLTVGQPTPGWFAGPPLAGCVLYSVRNPADTDRVVASVGRLLKITVAEDAA